MKLWQVLRRRLRSAFRLVAVSLSPAYAARVSNRFWQVTDQTHGAQTEADFEFYYQQIRAVVEPDPGQRIADYGCGEGSIGLAFQRDGFSVVGTDISRSFVATCRRRGLDCVGIDEFFDRDDRYDVIIANNVFLYVHPRHVARLLRRLHAKLLPGGRLFILDVPDLDKRHMVSSSLTRRALWAIFPVYYPESAAFFNDLTRTARIARSIGFRADEVQDSWADYRSHLILAT